VGDGSAASARVLPGAWPAGVLAATRMARDERHPPRIPPGRSRRSVTREKSGRARSSTEARGSHGKTSGDPVPGRGLVATSAPCPVADEVHGHRDTGSKEGGDTPSRRVTTSVLGRVHEHASGYRCRESNGDQEGDGIRRGHNGHDRRLTNADGSPGLPSRSDSSGARGVEPRGLPDDAA